MFSGFEADNREGAKTAKKTWEGEAPAEPRLGRHLALPIVSHHGRIVFLRALRAFAVKIFAVKIRSRRTVEENWL